MTSGRVEVITSVERRRRWSDDEKLPHWRLVSIGLQEFGSFHQLSLLRLS
jgi:hypothetical protein